MAFVRESAMIGGKEIIIETGKWAKQANGSRRRSLRRHDGARHRGRFRAAARHRLHAADLRVPRELLPCGKIPGSFFRREGRTTNEEILICRLMDRPVRPLFPKGWFIDTQIIASVVSFDKQNPTDVLAMTGASAALHCSDLVWAGPLAGVRIGRIDGQFVANPTFAEREQSDMDIIVAASKDAIMMVEGEMHELQEDVVIDALLFAHAAVQPMIELQERLRAANGKEKRAFTPPVTDEALAARVKDIAYDKLKEAMTIKDKKKRSNAVSALRGEALAAAGEKPTAVEMKAVDAEYERAEEEVGARSHAVDGARASTAADPTRSARSRSRPACCRARTARRCSRAARRRRSWRRRSAPATTSRARDAHSARNEDVHAALQLPAVLDGRGQAAARTGRGARWATAASPSARSCAMMPETRSSRTRSASCRKSWSGTAGRRWPRCAAARSR